MRGQARVVWLALLLAVLGAADGDAGGDAAGDEAAKGEEGGADGDDFDNFDDLESDDDVQEVGGDGQQFQGEAAVEDFDLAMPVEDQKVRMSACLQHTMSRVRTRQEQLQDTVKEAMTQQPQITQEQVLNSIVFSWMMTCYLNIDNEGIKAASQSQPPSPELENELFTERSDRPQQLRQASRRQWQLLEETIMENQQQQQQQRQQQQQAPQQSARGSLPLTGMSGQSAALYILVVFGVVFGLGAIVTYRLTAAEKAGREKSSSSKSQKKAEKAEKKLAKKKM